jgi:hypothetical protein
VVFRLDNTTHAIEDVKVAHDQPQLGQVWGGWHAPGSVLAHLVTIRGRRDRGSMHVVQVYSFFINQDMFWPRTCIVWMPSLSLSTSPFSSPMAKFQ